MSHWGLILWICFCAWTIRSTFKEKRKRRERKEYAHCNCGVILSEWFKYDGVMWHPEYVRGCGWLSPWGSHEEYRAELKSGGRGNER